MDFSDLGLSTEFLGELDTMEKSLKYRTQDLAFALLKVKKYQPDHYQQLSNDLTQGKIRLSLK